MCMVTEQLEPKIAEKNILVLKHSDGNGIFTFTSQWHNFDYGRFKKYFVNISKEITADGEFNIEAGFHSYINLERRVPYGAYFIIPKGAEYYEGGDNCSPKYLWKNDARVSNQIIYIGPRNKFTRLIAKIFYGV